MKDIYLVSCCRTAVGTMGGSLKDTPAPELGAIVARAALERAGLTPDKIDEVMFGCVLTAGLGQNVARQIAVKAGIPYEVPAYTIGMVCGSGMKSVIEGARAINSGEADVILCGGTENMSAAPYLVGTGRYGARMGDTKMVDSMVHDALWDAFNDYHMASRRKTSPRTGASPARSSTRSPSHPRKRPRPPLPPAALRTKLFPCPSR